MITGKLYDYSKFLALVLLPALGAAYFTLAGIWGLPSAEQVVGTIVVIDTFLGTILQLSSQQYKKGILDAGDMNIVELESGGKNFTLALNQEPEELEDAKEVRFKVQKKKQPSRRRPSA